MLNNGRHAADLLPHEYEALSYMWGDSTDRLPITVDGKSFEVTRHLYRFLDQMRHPTERRGWFCIDALCINHRGDKEKSGQVEGMGDIYMRARPGIGGEGLWDGVQPFQLLLLMWAWRSHEQFHS